MLCGPDPKAPADRAPSFWDSQPLLSSGCSLSSAQGGNASSQTRPQDSQNRMWGGAVWSSTLQETLSPSDSSVGCQGLPQPLLSMVKRVFSVHLCFCPLSAEGTLKHRSRCTLPASTLQQAGPLRHSKHILQICKP